MDCIGYRGSRWLVELVGLGYRSWRNCNGGDRDMAVAFQRYALWLCRVDAWLICGSMLGAAASLAALAYIGPGGFFCARRPCCGCFVGGPACCGLEFVFVLDGNSRGVCYIRPAGFVDHAVPGVVSAVGMVVGRHDPGDRLMGDRVRGMVQCE